MTVTGDFCKFLVHPPFFWSPLPPHQPRSHISNLTIPYLSSDLAIIFLRMPFHSRFKIWRYTDFPLWNSSTFCNFDVKYCQEIEHCSTNSVFPLLANRNLHSLSWMRVKKYPVTEIFPYITFPVFLMIDWFLVSNTTFSNIMATSRSVGRSRCTRRTTDHGQATGKLYYLWLRVECTVFCVIQSQARTHTVFVT
jgi:hypothetical protein